MENKIKDYIQTWFKPRKTINHGLPLETITALVMTGLGEKYDYIEDTAKMNKWRETVHKILKELGCSEKVEKQEIYGNDYVFTVSTSILREYNKRVNWKLKLEQPIYPTDAKIIFSVVKKLKGVK